MSPFLGFVQLLSHEQIQVKHSWQDYGRGDVYFLLGPSRGTYEVVPRLVMLSLIAWLRW